MVERSAAQENPFLPFLSFKTIKIEVVCAPTQVQLQQQEQDVAYRVLARGSGADPAGDSAALHDYFNLGTSLEALSQHWAAQDPRFCALRPCFPGAGDLFPQLLPQESEENLSLTPWH